MDPTVALPLHFTMETTLLVAAGLLLAWAALQKAWIAVVSALVLGIAQGMHAGQFLVADDDAAVVAMRFAALGGLALAVWQADLRRPLVGGGLAAVAAGAIWVAITGGSAIDPALGGHALMFVGACALIVWVWQATRPSVRLRVLASFVSVLAVAVVVAGGAVARVAAVNSRTNEYTHLGRQAAGLAGDLGQISQALGRRVAAVSPGLAIPMARGDRARVDEARVFTLEWAAVLSKDSKVRTTTSGPGGTVPYRNFAQVPSVAGARLGRVTSATDVRAGTLVLTSAAPIYRPGSSQTKQDVIGIVVLGLNRPATELQAMVADETVDVAAVAGDRIASSDADLGAAALDPQRRDGFQRIERAGEQWYASVVQLSLGDAAIIVASRDDAIVDPSTDLVRAFLIAILAAALLAVVAALWLSARITRPMLDLADEAERVKTDFLASVSHELRTPLTPIRGYTEILRHGRVPARDQSEYLDEIGLATQRLERIVALLVDVAAIEAGRFLIDINPVDATGLLNDALERWENRSRKHTVEVRVPRALPPVKADENAIGRVLDELIDNAIKFAPEGIVELHAKRTQKGVEISVRDNGPGMDAKRIASATGAFSQAETGDTRRFGGLGLGLSFVDGVLLAHGVRLQIESTLGRGTTCSFVLPAAGSVTRMPDKAAARK